jgi:hypothetical protein
VKDLRQEPWWTAADVAELDMLVHELVGDVFEHRESCPHCMAGLRCAWIQAAIERVAEWRDRRILRSKALWLRREQNRLDAGQRLTIERLTALLALTAAEERGGVSDDRSPAPAVAG